MTHTVHMSTPIRPGTARRLGLRPAQPRGIITIDRQLSEAEYEELRAKWQAVVAEHRGRIEVLRDWPLIPAPRRRWWQRRKP